MPEHPLRRDSGSKPRFIVRMEYRPALPEWRHRPPYSGAWVVWDREREQIAEPANASVFEPLDLHGAWARAEHLNGRVVLDGKREVPWTRRSDLGDYELTENAEVGDLVLNGATLYTDGWRLMFESLMLLGGARIVNGTMEIRPLVATTARGCTGMSEHSLRGIR